MDLTRTGQVLGRAESITYGGGMGKSRVEKRTCGIVLVGKYFLGEIKKPQLKLSKVTSNGFES